MKYFIIYLFVLIINFSAIAQNAGELIANTGYDYSHNNSPLRFFSMEDINNDGDPDPLAIVMIQYLQSGKRTCIFYYKDNSGWHSASPFDTTGTFGWPSLQHCKDGPLDGKILFMGHSNGKSFWAVYNPFDSSVVRDTVGIDGNFPSFIYLPDGTIFMTNAKDNGLLIHKSTNLGESWTVHTSIGEGDPDFSAGNITDQPSELPIRSSPNRKHLSITGCFKNASTTGNPDIVYNYYSDDYGETWQGRIIGWGSGENPLYGQIINRDYAPYFCNFSQLSAEVDNNGTTHVIINGYGEYTIAPDSTDYVYPVLYWNSLQEEWNAVSNIVNESNTDGCGNYVINWFGGRLYAGFGIGQAYPTLSVSEDGGIVVAAWQGFEYTNGPGSEWNIYPGDGGPESSPYYYTDIYSNVSMNGGISWPDEITLIQNETDEMEQYVLLSPYLEQTNLYKFIPIHFIYQLDAIPGVRVVLSQFTQNSWSNETAWYYQQKDIIITNIDKEERFLDSYLLSQNYPNPFNPNTVIKYQLPEAGNVTLKVYDVLGSEIATLVNEYKNAGSYEVEFHPESGIRHLASGVYYYQMKAGSFIQTKKMILLK